MGAVLSAPILLLKEPTDEVVNAKASAYDDGDQSQNQAGDDVFKFLISILIRRRELVLWKIWRWTVHGQLSVVSSQSFFPIPFEVTS